MKLFIDDGNIPPIATFMIETSDVLTRVYKFHHNISNNHQKLYTKILLSVSELLKGIYDVVVVIVMTTR